MVIVTLQQIIDERISFLKEQIISENKPQVNKTLQIQIDVIRSAADVNATEALVMAVSQKPFNQSNFVSPSGPPAWKQLPTWYQLSESDRMIPPDTQRMFAQRMNATTISIDTSHSSYVAHPDEIAQLILDAAAAAQPQGNNPG